MLINMFEEWMNEWMKESFILAEESGPHYTVLQLDLDMPSLTEDI